MIYMYSTLSICSVLASTRYTGIHVTTSSTLSIFALGCRAIVLIQGWHHPLHRPLLKKPAACPALPCSGDCCTAVSGGRQEGEENQEKQTQPRGRLGWYTANGECCRSLQRGWSGQEEGSVGENDLLYTASCSIKNSGQVQTYIHLCLSKPFMNGRW